jgi:hAT family C-terminal dimerisation region
VRKWWLLPEQKRDYPNLSQMALDILSIPAMSASIERLFSSANITVSDRRNHLTPNTIEIIESLKSWQKLKEAV